MRKLFINKIVSILLLLTILLPHSLFSQEKLVESKVPAPVLPTNTTDTLSQIEALRTSLEKLPTHLSIQNT